MNWPETRIAIFSAPRVERAARLDRVLRLQRLQQLRNVEAHGGELLGGELEVDLLVLRADQIDLGNVGNAEQLAAQTLGMVAQLAMGKAVRGQGEDERIGVAELVIEERPSRPAATSA